MSTVPLRGPTGHGDARLTNVQDVVRVLMGAALVVAGIGHLT